MRPITSRTPSRRVHRLGPRGALIVLPILGLTLGAVLHAQRAPSSGSTPERLGLGRAASPAEIAALDIDIMPDGSGLPAGGGTVARGAQVYDERCFVCHGDKGEDGLFDRLTGREPRDDFPFATREDLRKTIGNYWPYATTLFDYTYRAMPFEAPGTLEPDEVYSLVAYLLYLNEIVPESAVMNAETLPKVVMPARDRFVDDNRRGGAEIR